MNRTACFAVVALLLTPACSPDMSAPLAPETASDIGSEPLVAAPLLPAGPRLHVVLMSSLPLVYGAGVDMAGMIAGRSHPHPLYEELNAAHDLLVADALGPDTLAGADLVVLVQPHVLPPDALVALDDFVRGGGRLLLFADPALDWAAGRGLSDPQGPLRSVLISPLLAHWGLVLDDPGQGEVRLRPTGTVLVHPGRFAHVPGKNSAARCRMETQAYVARCAIGEGTVIMVADADLLAPDMISDSADSGLANRMFIAALFSAIIDDDSS